MSLWDRIGDVFESAKDAVTGNGVSIPVGSVVDLASTFSNPLGAALAVGTESAKAVGSAFFKSSFGQAASAAVGQGLTWAERNVWSPATDYVEASGRYYQDVATDPETRRFDQYTMATFGLGAMDPTFREEYWLKARANDSSIMQTVWEMDQAARGDKDSGFVDPSTGKWTLPLIDDPARRADREEYFSQGSQKWVTGIGDAALSVVLDPVNVLTGGAGKAIELGTQLTGKSISSAAAAGRGAGAVDVAEIVRGSANTAEVTPGSIRLDPSDMTSLADDAPRSYLRSKLGDDGIQSLYDEARTVLSGEGDKTTALMQALESRGLNAEKVLDDARFAKGDGKLTPEHVLTSAGEDLMEKNGVEALFEGQNASPFFRRSLENQDPVQTNLGWNATKYKSNVEKLTDYAWAAKGKPGTVAAIADDYVLGQSSDTGAIADAMSWVASTIADEKVAKGLMDDLQYAAAGDGGALRRIEAYNTRFALDIEGLASLDRTAALDAINASPLKTPAEKLKVANDDDLFVRMRAEIEPELTEMVRKFGQFQSSVARVQAAGTLDGLAPGGLKGAGDITRIPLLGTWQPFKSLPPVRVLGGTHLPEKMRLDDPEAVTIYSTWMDRQTSKLGFGSERDLALTGQFKDDFVAAADADIDPGMSRGARANAVYRANQAFRRSLVKKHAALHGVDESEIETWIDTALDVRQTELGAIIQGARTSVESGSASMVRLPGGEIVTTADEMNHALGTSQFQEMADLTDWGQMDKWLKNRFKPGYVERAERGVAETAGEGKVQAAKRITTELMEEVNDAWKVAALFRPAYTLRVQIDTQARNLATFGALRHMDFLFKAVGNFASNTKFVDKQVVELVNRKREAFDELTYLLERGENDERVEALQKIVDMDLDTFKASGLSKVEPGRVQRRKTDLKTIQGDAEKIDVETGAYQRDQFGTYQRGDASMRATLGEGVQESVEGLYRSSNAYFQKKLRKQLGYNYVDYGTSPTTRKAWTQGYLESVNHGLRNDAAWGRMLAGANDETIIEWMERSPDGKAYFKEMNRSGHFDSVEDLVARQRAHFDNLIPDRDAADLAAARDITADDIADWWSGDTKTRPFVPTKISEALRENAKATPYDVYDAGRRYYFRLAAQMPETYMGRHPQYHRFYQSNMQRFIEASGKDKKAFTLEEINHLRKRTDAAARKDMAKIMFDTSHKSELGHHLRFISPFFSAWEDTMFKWSKIAKENPAATYNTLVRPFESLTSTNNVYDGEGNRIMPNGEKRLVNEDGSLGEVVGHTTSINEGYMLFTLPDWMTPGEGEQDFRLSRGSLNAIFQGEDWWSPGVGPAVQIPMNETVKNAFPEIGDNPIVQTILPYGATSENVAEQGAPAHMKNGLNAISAALGNESSEGFQDTFNIAMQDELVRQRSSGKLLSEKETIQKVTKATRNLLFLKWMGSGVMPASTTPQSRLDWYRKEYRRYQSEDPRNALKNFTADHPEFTEVTISLRDNEAGIAATEEATNAADPWKSEIAVNPEIGWAMAGADNYKGEFSRDVYTNQAARGWRTREDSGETFDRINISKGWQDWQTLTNLIDAELDKRGLTSLMSKGAEDLVALKGEVKAEIMRDNPSWAEEYNAGGGGADKATDFLNKMNGAMARNPKKTAERQDLLTMQTYITERESLRAVMAEYGVSSLPTEAELAEFISGERGGEPVRFALAQEWYNFVATLKNDSPVFADTYSRAGLERDALTNPVVEG